MIINVRRIGDPILKQRCEPVVAADINEDLTNSLIMDMIETMREHDGIGLAANQIGVSKRILVIDIGVPLAMINPTIWEFKNWVVGEEGCLSIPGENYEINRATWIKIKFTNLQGQEHRVIIDDRIIARVVQHEVDHLDGILLCDK